MHVCLIDVWEDGLNCSIFFSTETHPEQAHFSPSRRQTQTPLTYGCWLPLDDTVFCSFFPVQHFFVYQLCNRTGSVRRWATLIIFTSPPVVKIKCATGRTKTLTKQRSTRRLMSFNQKAQIKAEVIRTFPLLHCVLSLIQLLVCNCRWWLKGKKTKNISNSA